MLRCERAQACDRHVGEIAAAAASGGLAPARERSFEAVVPRGCHRGAVAVVLEIESFISESRQGSASVKPS